MVVVPSTTLSIGCWWKFIVLCMFVFHSPSHSRSLLSSSKYLLLVEGSEGSTNSNGANKWDSISSDNNNNNKTNKKENNNSVVTTEGFIIRAIVKNSSIISNAAAAAVAAADDDDKEVLEVVVEEEDNAHRHDHHHDDPHNDLHLPLEHRMSISDMTCDYFQQPLNHFVPRGKSPTYMERYCTYDGYTVTANKTNNITTTTTTTDAYNNDTITPIFFYTGNESPLEQYINQVRVRYHIILFLSFFSFFQMEI